MAAVSGAETSTTKQRIITLPPTSFALTQRSSRKIEKELFEGLQLNLFGEKSCSSRKRLMDFYIKVILKLKKRNLVLSIKLFLISISLQPSDEFFDVYV